MKKAIGSTKTESKAINLQPGDIIIEVEVTPEGVLEPKHTWIFASKDPVVAHSATGGGIGVRIRGVTRHTFNQLVFRSDKVVVLRCKNEKLKELIIRVTESFASVFNNEEREELKKLNVKPHNPDKVNVWQEKKINYTPYSMVRNESESSELNQFRSARDALRTGITELDKTPLSKICGVSCDEFVGYIIQSALVILLLDKKINQLETLIKTISATRREIDPTSGNKKTAADLLTKFSEEFKKLSAEQKLPSEMIKSEVLSAISYAVKGNSIKNSMPFWESLSLFQRFEGIFSIDPPKVQPQSLAELVKKPENLLPFQDGDSASDSEGDDENIPRKFSMDSNSDDGLDIVGKQLSQPTTQSQVKDEKSTHRESVDLDSPTEEKHNVSSLATLSVFSHRNTVLSKDDFELLKRDKQEKQKAPERRHSFDL